MDSGLSEEKFRELLNAEYSWPTNYIFKFVVPSDKIKEVKELFSSEADITTKSSSGGKYTSVTINIEIASADEIIAIYAKASTIEGIISL